MKILFMTTSASLLDWINRHILTVAVALNHESNVTVAVCSTHPRGELHVKLEECGIKTYSLNASNGHKFSILWRYYQLLKEFRPDIVHMHVMPILAGIVLKYMFPFAKKVTTIHGIGINTNRQTVTVFYYLKKRVRTIVQFVLNPKSDFTCYISKGVREFYKKNGYNTKQSCVIYNPAPSRFTAKTKHLHNLLKINDRCKIIGTACRIAKIKQPIIFAKVMSEVLKAKKNVHAVILGDGEQELVASIAEYIEQEKLRDRFHLLGYRQDAATLLGGLDCFILTSKQEGMPTAMLEAMS